MLQERCHRIANTVGRRRIRFLHFFTKVSIIPRASLLLENGGQKILAGEPREPGISEKEMEIKGSRTAQRMKYEQRNTVLVSGQVGTERGSPNRQCFQRAPSRSGSLRAGTKNKGKGGG